MNIPTIFTLIRVILIPVFVLFFYIPVWWSHLISAAIFACACLTDWLDGYLARTLQQTSRLGAFLDPVADKLMVAVALVLIVGEPNMPYLAIPAAVIVGREIVISALREWMAEIGKRASVAVSFIAKTKTAIQMIALILLLAYRPAEPTHIIMILGYVLLYLAALLTLWTMILYIRAAWSDLVKSAEIAE